MKKIIFSMLAAFSMLSASAQNEFCMKPVHAEAGDDVDLEFFQSTDFDTKGYQFSVILPKGFNIILKSSNIKEGKSYDYVGAAESVDWTMKTAKTEVDGKEQINFAYGSGDAMKPVNEVSFVIYASVDDAVEDGVYPVQINVTKVSNGTDKAVTANYVSYVVVGNPTGASVALSGTVANTVLDALKTETAISSVDLSAATAINGEFAYTVGKAVTAPSLTADVKVVAGLNGGKYGSLCSPVALPGVKCYKFTGASGDVATFTEVDDVPANEVVIIDAAVNASVTGATLASVENGNAAAGCLYVAPNGSELRRAKNAVTVPALRGTWDIAGGSNLRIALDTPTGIKMIGTAEEVLGNTYDLQGRQVEKAQNGVYVVNGKKQFVK